MFRKLVLSMSMLTVVATQTQAALLELQGIAAVDRGGGFEPAVNNMLLKPGDRIRVGRGCAQIVYGNGNRTKVCDGHMAVVLADTPAFVPPGIPGPALVVGVLEAGGLAAGLALSGNGNNEAAPASP